MNRYRQPDHESTSPLAPMNLGDLPVVMAPPATVDEDRELDEDLEDDPELAVYYRDLAEINEVIIEAHQLLTAPDNDQ